jgi:hypothetical protein
MEIDGRVNCLPSDEAEFRLVMSTAGRRCPFGWHLLLSLRGKTIEDESKQLLVLRLRIGKQAGTVESDIELPIDGELIVGCLHP